MGIISNTIMETVIQTRLPEELNKKLKMEALSNGVHTKRRVSAIFNAFIEKEPWLCGTWVKQPKTIDSFRPLTVKIPTEQAYIFEKLAERLEVSTSSLAYTAIDWHFRQPFAVPVEPTISEKP